MDLLPQDLINHIFEYAPFRPLNTKVGITNDYKRKRIIKIIGSAYIEDKDLRVLFDLVFIPLDDYNTFKVTLNKLIERSSTEDVSCFEFFMYGLNKLEHTFCTDISKFCYNDIIYHKRENLVLLKALTEYKSPHHLTDSKELYDNWYSGTIKRYYYLVKRPFKPQVITTDYELDTFKYFLTRIYDDVDWQIEVVFNTLIDEDCYTNIKKCLYNIYIEANFIWKLIADPDMRSLEYLLETEEKLLHYKHYLVHAKVFNSNMNCIRNFIFNGIPITKNIDISISFDSEISIFITDYGGYYTRFIREVALLSGKRYGTSYLASIDTLFFPQFRIESLVIEAFNIVVLPLTKFDPDIFKTVEYYNTCKEVVLKKFNYHYKISPYSIYKDTIMNMLNKYLS